VILLIEPAQERRALALGEAHQILVALSEGRAFDPSGRAGTEHQMLHDIAHQSDERQVDGLGESYAHRDDALIVGRVEIFEAVDAAAGEERFTGIGRVTPFHGGVEHGGQAAIGCRAQVIERPARQGIVRAHLHPAQRLAIQIAKSLVQLGDDLQVGHERAQLRGRAQVEFRLIVHIEGPIRAVGLHAYYVAIGGALEQDEAVGDVAQIARCQQVLAEKPCLTRLLWIAK
jgi:hypothetical protein